MTTTELSVQREKLEARWDALMYSVTTNNMEETYSDLRHRWSDVIRETTGRLVGGWRADFGAMTPAFPHRLV